MTWKQDRAFGDRIALLEQQVLRAGGSRKGKASKGGKGKTGGKAGGKGAKGKDNSGGWWGKGNAESAQAAAPTAHRCTNCHKVGHHAKDCWAPSLEDIACRTCGKYGHRKAECPANSKECNRCGKVGRLEAVCRTKLPADNKGENVTQEGEVNGTKPVWRCVECDSTQYHDRNVCFQKNCRAHRVFLDDDGEKLDSAIAMAAGFSASIFQTIMYTVMVICMTCSCVQEAV